MTKLEEKLVELGYERNQCIPSLYTKHSIAVPNEVIFFSIFHTEIDDKGIIPNANIREEKDIDLLYAVMKELQKDLKILKECEK